MAVVGSVAVAIKADTKQFSTGLGRASQSISRFSSRILGATAGIIGFGSAIAAVGGFTFLIKRQFALIDTTAKVADKLGLTTEALVGLQFAAQQTGVPINQLNLGIQRMTRRIAEAALGMGESQGALKELGIEASVIAKLPVDEQFKLIADQMEKVTSQSDRVRLGFKLFDSEGVALILTMRGGAAALEGFRRQADALNIVFSREEAARIEAFNDAMKRMILAVVGIAQSIAIKLAPTMERWANIVVGLTTKNKELIFGLLRGALTTAKWTAAVLVGVTVIPRVIAVVALLVRTLRSLASAQILVTALTPLGLLKLSAAFAGAAAFGVIASIAFDKMESSIGGVISEAEEAGKAISDLSSKTDAATSSNLDFTKSIQEVSAASKEQQELMRKAGAIFEATRTPVEKFAANLKDLAAIFAADLIDADTLRRAVEAANKELAEATEAPDVDRAGRAQVGALERGTQAAIAAEATARGATDKFQRNQEKQLAEAKEQTTRLDRIIAGLSGLREQPVEEVVF